MYCSNCGKQLNEDVKFCPNCGQKNLGLDKNTAEIPATRVKPIEPAELRHKPEEHLSPAAVAGTVAYGAVGIIQLILHYLGWIGIIGGVIAILVGNTTRGQELFLSGIGLLALEYILGLIFVGSVLAINKISKGSDKKSFKTWFLPFLVGGLPGFWLASYILGSNSVLMAAINGVIGALFGNLSVYIFTNKIFKKKTPASLSRGPATEEHKPQQVERKLSIQNITSALLIGGVVLGLMVWAFSYEPTPSPIQTHSDLIGDNSPNQTPPLLVGSPANLNPTYYYDIIKASTPLENGKTIEVDLTTRTDDQTICQGVNEVKIEEMKQYWQHIEGQCSGGLTYNRLIRPYFDNQPMDKAYVSFKDSNGRETRLTFLNFDKDATVTVAEGARKSFEQPGPGAYSDVKVIYPLN